MIVVTNVSTNKIRANSGVEYEVKVSCGFSVRAYQPRIRYNWLFINPYTDELLAPTLPGDTKIPMVIDTATAILKGMIQQALIDIDA